MVALFQITTFRRKRLFTLPFVFAVVAEKEEED
jgi:hypothetical protein